MCRRQNRAALQRICYRFQSPPPTLLGRSSLTTFFTLRECRADGMGTCLVLLLPCWDTIFVNHFIFIVLMSFFHLSHLRRLQWHNVLPAQVACGASADRGPGSICGSALSVRRVEFPFGSIGVFA